MSKVTTSYNIAAISVMVLFSALFASCQANKAKITGKFIGGDSSVVYLEELKGLQGSIIDSAKLNSKGEFIFNIATKEPQHKIYNVVYDWSIIPLFVAPGDKIVVNSVGNVAKNYTVEGSEESDLVRTFYQNYIKGISALDKIAMNYASEGIDDEQRDKLAREYSAEHNRIKREQLEFIITNKDKLSAVYALYQRLPNDSYLFNGRSDIIYYRTVAAALEETYPDSPYLKSIQKDIEEFDRFNEISNNIVELGYPDLELKDIYGKQQKLSDLDGKVILIDFWSAQLGNSNQHNAELRELYADLKDQGFEIYQVAIDSSKSTWINMVQEQSLPWISVSDLKGSSSPTLTLYNITALPSNFLIGKDGNIVTRDVAPANLEALIKSELAK